MYVWQVEESAQTSNTQMCEKVLTSTKYQSFNHMILPKTISIANWNIFRVIQRYVTYS